MINISEVQTGKRYNCNFTVPECPLDEFGRPGGFMSMADLPVVRTGSYSSTGELVARDLKSELVEVLCDKINKKFVVKFADLENITESDE